ncbi:MAG: AI-2E family transporter [Suipraeoptans sp.]
MNESKRVSKKESKKENTNSESNNETTADNTAADSTAYSEKPIFVKRDHAKWRQTWEQGKVYFFVIAFSLIFYFALLRLDSLSGLVSKLSGILMPFSIGIVFAYLLTPMVKFFEKPINKFLSSKLKSEKRIFKWSRSLSITASLLIVFAVLTTLLNMVIPELFISIRGLILSVPNGINNLLKIINNYDFGDTTTGNILRNALTEGATAIQNWISTDLLAQINVIMGSLTEGIYFALNTIFNVLIGLIISIYLLFSKEKFLAQAKKTLYAFVKPDLAYKTLHITSKSNEIFGGFISGKILDSLIVGIICFIVMSIFNMPYTMLVSVIIGFTNIIPFFGPFIGAVPSALLILIEDPRMALYFIIFVIILQQIDGNIIGPKILGNSTGLPAFWVIFAILIGGGMFGFIGMIMGVPTFSVIYYIIQTIINQQLDKKDLPSHSQFYNRDSYISSEGDYKKPDENDK